MADSQPLFRQAASVEAVTDMTDLEAAYNEISRHWYPRDPRYRRSGASEPRPGDIAYCGHVKQQPHNTNADWVDCPSCNRIKALNNDHA